MENLTQLIREMDGDQPIYTDGLDISLLDVEYSYED